MVQTGSKDMKDAKSRNPPPENGALAVEFNTLTYGEARKRINTNPAEVFQARNLE